MGDANKLGNGTRRKQRDRCRGRCLCLRCAASATATAAAVEGDILYGRSAFAALYWRTTYTYIYISDSDKGRAGEEEGRESWWGIR